MEKGNWKELCGDHAGITIIMEVLVKAMIVHKPKNTKKIVLLPTFSKALKYKIKTNRYFSSFPFHKKSHT